MKRTNVMTKSAMRYAAVMTVMAMALTMPVTAQSTDDELFGGWDDDDAFFVDADDDMFGGFGGDDGIVDLTGSTLSAGQVSTIFEAGSIKIGGNWSMSVSTATSFDKDTAFADSLYDTTMTVNADAQLYIDARPTDGLRMYMKGGINYPYVTSGDAKNTTMSDDLIAIQQQMAALRPSTPGTDYYTTTYNGFYVKELFTDFDITNSLSGRFGKQTITWGVGYFYSPASNMVNLSAIDPEDPTAQVDGPLALKLTGTLPGQNILYLYAIPETSITGTYGSLSYTQKGSTQSYIRDTALAAKTELVFGAFELGLGGWYKYGNDPVAMATLTGPCTRYGSFFAEGTGTFGDDITWKGTAGAMFTFNDPGITLMAQYYYNGEEPSAAVKAYADMYPTMKLALQNGSNIAGTLAFSKLGIDNVSANIFGMYNITNETMLAKGTVSYSGLDNLSFSAGPTVTWTSFDTDPTVSVTLSATLGGGKF